MYVARPTRVHAIRQGNKEPLCSDNPFETESAAKKRNAYLLHFFILNTQVHCHSHVAGATSSVSFAAFCLKLTLSFGETYCHSPADGKPSQTSNILIPFKLSLCLMVSCQHCGDLESHFREFTQHSNNVSTDVTLHVLEALLIYFLFVTRRSIQPLWLLPYQIQF